jgi:putative phage-type endonuclease
MSIMFEQLSEEWRTQRLGKVTGSRLGDMIAKTRSGWAASRRKYMTQLMVERWKGVPYEARQNEAMRWGSLCESEAKTAYEFFRDAEIEPAPFVQHPRIAMAGASPDGFVGVAGLVEIKCPESETHLETFVGEDVPENYLPQIQFQLACTGREWCDFVSYDPRLPASMQLWVKRVLRDAGMIGYLENCVEEFLFELDTRMAAIERKAKMAQMEIA